MRDGYSVKVGSGEEYSAEKIGSRVFARPASPTMTMKTMPTGQYLGPLVVRRETGKE
jgi:hypothetical protein